MKTISIVTINQPSLSAGKRLQKLLCEFDVTLYQKNKTTKQQNNCIAYDKLDEIMPRIWKSDAIIFLLACGIVVRKIAPFLETVNISKYRRQVERTLKKIEKNRKKANKNTNNLCIDYILSRIYYKRKLF